MSCNHITTLNWPPYSPDLNPIENVWAIIKSKLKLHPVHTLDQLEHILHRIWLDLQDNLAVNLINSMHNRCLKVIRNNGLRV